MNESFSIHNGGKIKCVCGKLMDIPRTPLTCPSCKQQYVYINGRFITLHKNHIVFV
jgi:hypothetical protein